MAFRLHRTPRQLLRECDSYDLSELMAFMDVEHLGVTDDERADIREAITASVVANVYRKEEVKPDPFTFEDFIPRFERDDEWDGSAVNMSPEAFSTLMHARFQA